MPVSGQGSKLKHIHWKGKVTEVKEWGFRELAYEIANNKRGYYVVFDVEATKEAVNEFNRIAGYSETIIRSIVIVKGE